MSRIPAFVTAVAVIASMGLHLQINPSSAAEMSENEEQIYMYGLYLGWAAAECNLYEQGNIAKTLVLATFTRIGRDKDLSDLSKSAIYKTIEQSNEFPKCQQALRDWKR